MNESQVELQYVDASVEESRVCFRKPYCLCATILRGGILQLPVRIESVSASCSLPFFPDDDVVVVLPLAVIRDASVHILFRPLILHPFYLQPPPPSPLSLPAHFRSFFSHDQGLRLCW